MSSIAGLELKMSKIFGNRKTWKPISNKSLALGYTWKKGVEKMLGNFGISVIGIIYMLMLEVPNLMWVKRKPEGYDPTGENKVLLVIERVGMVMCTASILIFTDYLPRGADSRIGWFIASLAFMLVYEGYWIRYFRSPRGLWDFYRPFLGVPVPGATLPVIAFLLLGIDGQVGILVVSAIILGIGHIGIHLGHIRKRGKNNP